MRWSDLSIPVRLRAGAGALLGFGFLTKQLQVLLVVPGFALTYLICAPSTLMRRVKELLLAGLAMVAAAGWWIAIVELTPAQYRPYIGGSQNNSILELTLGYNGFGRLTGDETGSVGGAGNWGATGWGRLFNDEIGGQISWLIPSALVLLLAGAVVARRVRTDPARTQLLMWGTWLVVTALTFSFMAGIFHAYYAVALAPAIAGTVAAGAGLLRERRGHIAARAVLAGSVALAGIWSFMLLQRTPDFQSWLGPVVLMAGLGAAVGIAAGALLPRWVAAVSLGGAIVAGLGGPVAYSVQTVSHGSEGSIVSAGPTVPGSSGFGGGGVGRGARGGQGGGTGVNGPAGGLGGGQTGGQPGLQPGGTTTGGVPTGGTTTGGVPTGGVPTGGGGLLSSTTPSVALVAALKANAGNYTWVAATTGSNNASGYQLATEEPVMSIGGFNGSDPSPTLAQFKDYVAKGQIHYYIAGSIGGGGAAGGSNDSSQISAWVQENYTAVTVGGAILYDLSASVNAS